VAGGVRPIRLHDLRHGSASLLLASGADMALASKRLGHSSLGITVDTRIRTCWRALAVLRRSGLR
jgi:integrase